MLLVWIYFAKKLRDIISIQEDKQGGIGEKSF